MVRCGAWDVENVKPPRESGRHQEGGEGAAVSGCPCSFRVRHREPRRRVGAWCGAVDEIFRETDASAFARGPRGGGLYTMWSRQVTSRHVRERERKDETWTTGAILRMEAGEPSPQHVVVNPWKGVSSVSQMQEKRETETDIHDSR